MWIEAAVENTLYHFDKPFSYAVPPQFENVLKPGMRIMVPFGRGNSGRVGLVLSLLEEPGEENTLVKPILDILDKEPVLTAEMLTLVHWIKERCFCTLFEAARLMIPAGFGYRIKNSYMLKDGVTPDGTHTGIKEEIIALLYAAVKSVPFEVLAQNLGITESCPDFLELQQEGAVLRVNKASTKVKDAFSKMVRAVPDFTGKLSPRQAEVYQTLLETGTVAEKELLYFTGASAAIVKALAEKGAAERFECEAYRRPEITVGEAQASGEIVLSQEQQAAFIGLKAEFDAGKSACSLLYGVTGSGKTSVFMKLIQHVYAEGRDIIVMVPEISLTTQTIRQFVSVFGETVAVFHSRLSMGEKLDEWKRVKQGTARIVVGTRSAVFAPVHRLGLVVIDEEQEHTYKSESSPRYDAREVAMKRCAEHHALCLFTSATPSVESYYAAMSGRFSLYKLTARFGEAEMPDVSLIDLNNEDMPEGQMLMSPTMRLCLKENYERGKQSIILLNRRGYHTFVACRECGEIAACPHCSISLTYHAANGRLMCHYCGYSVAFKNKCAVCGSEHIQFRGSGTQKAEEELAEFLPAARVLRVDTDSTAGKYSLETKLKEFGEGKYDIMVGTQMVAKGLDFGNVTLVGVLSADLMLFSDDFRSNERAFDLLTQVVGRAGRRKEKGEALIQTYCPENEYLALAANQDYDGFYQTESTFRKALLYPPFVDLCIVGFTGANERKVKQAATSFLGMLGVLAKKQYAQLPMRVLQPAPAAVAKISEKYRYKILIKCKNTTKFREMISLLLKQFAADKTYSGVTAHAAVNPYQVW